MQHTEANKISIPLRGNYKLAEVLTGCGTGDKVCLKEVYVTIDEATSELITGTIDEIEEARVIEHPAGDATDEEKEEARKSPVMSVMGAPDRDRDQGKARDAFTA